MAAGRLGRLVIALAAPIMLLSCVLVPGKFESTLRIDADRSFAFAYKGEVIALDMGEEIAKDTADDAAGTEASPTKPLIQDKDDKRGDAAEREAKRRAIAVALRKEQGYRSVEYLGDGKYLIDYSISGVLTHNFVYPFNADAEILFPFIAIELRANDTVRVRAPGFANEADDKSPPGRDAAASKLDGVFTLDTNAEIVSQNSEDGAAMADGRSTIAWRATPLTKDAPMAVLRVN